MFLYSYHAYFIFWNKPEKSIRERNERLNLKSILINWGTQFLILADWIIENDLCQTYAWFLNCLSKGRGFDCFSQTNVLPKLSKISDVSLKWTITVDFDVPRVSRMAITFELLKVCNMTSLKVYVCNMTSLKICLKLRRG